MNSPRKFQKIIHLVVAIDTSYKDSICDCIVNAKQKETENSCGKAGITIFHSCMTSTLTKNMLVNVNLYD